MQGISGKFSDTKRRRSTGQQPGTKSASSPAVKPDMNRLSTADFVLAFGLNGISLVRASGGTFRRRVFEALGGASRRMRPICSSGSSRRVLLRSSESIRMRLAMFQHKVRRTRLVAAVPTKAVRRQGIIIWPCRRLARCLSIGPTSSRGMVTL